MAEKEKVHVVNVNLTAREGILPGIFKTAGFLTEQVGHVSQEVGKRIGGVIRLPGGKEAKEPGKELKGLKEPEKIAKISQLGHEHQYSNVLTLRQLLSSEKARMIEVIRHQKPLSIYDLAKKLGRDFKAVRQDLELLRHFHIIGLVKETGKSKKGKEIKRQRLRPVLTCDKLQLNLQI